MVQHSVGRHSLFFNAGSDESFVKPEKTDFEDNDDGTKNEIGQVSITGEEIGGSHHPPLHRSTRQRRSPSLCHLCDQEIKEDYRRSHTTADHVAL